MKDIVTFSSLGYMGELGNQMFEVAATIGYARKYDKEPVFPEWTCKISGRDYRSIFKNSVNQSFSPKNVLHHRIQYDGLLYQDLPFYPGNVDLRGYFQSEKYFLHCKQEIRDLFQPSDLVREIIEKNYSEILSEKNKVCLQMRTYSRSRNDYDVHNSITSEYIEKAQELHADSALYVISTDNIERAKSILPNGKKYVFMEDFMQEPPNYVKLFLMTYFDSYILSASTFGWWGAWLSQCDSPDVTIMKNWFTVGKAKEYLNNNDISPDRWRIIL